MRGWIEKLVMVMVEGSVGVDGLERLFCAYFCWSCESQHCRVFLIFVAYNRVGVTENFEFPVELLESSIFVSIEKLKQSSFQTFR